MSSHALCHLPGVTKIPISVKGKPKKKVDADVKQLDKKVSKITINGHYAEGQDVKDFSVASKKVVSENAPKFVANGPVNELKTNSTGTETVVKRIFEKGKVRDSDYELDGDVESSFKH